MIFFYAAIVLLVVYALAIPFFEQTALDYEDAFSEQEKSMKSQDLQFKKEMIRESLEDVETDLRMNKISEQEYSSLRDDLYEEAGSLMTTEKGKKS